MGILYKLLSPACGQWYTGLIIYRDTEYVTLLACVDYDEYEEPCWFLVQGVTIYHYGNLPW